MTAMWTNKVASTRGSEERFEYTPSGEKRDHELGGGQNWASVVANIIRRKVQRSSFKLEPGLTHSQYHRGPRPSRPARARYAIGGLSDPCAAAIRPEFGNDTFLPSLSRKAEWAVDSSPQVVQRGSIRRASRPHIRCIRR